MTSFGSGTEDREDETPMDIESILRRAIEVIDTAKSMPLSASVIVSREDMRSLLEQGLENLPLEIRQANWMLRERAEFLAKMEREGDEILRAARERAERMVQRSELVREAQRTAQKTIEESQEEARRLKHEAEDYCDQKLAAFEIQLEKIWKTVQGGREKLRGMAVINVDQPIEPVYKEDEMDAFFDQDQEMRRN